MNKQDTIIKTVFLHDSPVGETMIHYHARSTASNTPESSNE
jgi:hypothetical protein